LFRKLLSNTLGRKEVRIREAEGEGEGKRKADKATRILAAKLVPLPKLYCNRCYCFVSKN